VALLAACQQPSVVEKIVKETVEVEKEVEKIVKETVVVEKEKVVEVVGVSTRQAPMLQEKVKAGELPRWRRGCPWSRWSSTPMMRSASMAGPSVLVRTEPVYTGATRTFTRSLRTCCASSPI